MNFFVAVKYNFLPKYCARCENIDHGEWECRKQQDKNQMLKEEGYWRRQEETARHLQRLTIFNQVEGRRNVDTVHTLASENQHTNSESGQ